MSQIFSFSALPSHRGLNAVSKPSAEIKENLSALVMIGVQTQNVKISNKKKAIHSLVD